MSAPDEFTVARARKQNAETAAAVEGATWDSVENGLNVLIGEYRKIVALSSEGAARDWAFSHLRDDGSQRVLAALVTHAIGRLAKK